MCLCNFQSHPQILHSNFFITLQANFKPLNSIQQRSWQVHLLFTQVVVQCFVGFSTTIASFILNLNPLFSSICFLYLEYSSRSVLNWIILFRRITQLLSMTLIASSKFFLSPNTSCVRVKDFDCAFSSSNRNV